MFYNTNMGGANMGYRVKWVEENLGVSRKALRIFEEKGLMPKNNGKYRDYSNEDIDRIWAIRVLQGMGFTLSEIEKLANDENFDFEASLEKKVKELQEKKEKIDRHLGYARTIKLTGRFPSRPKERGSIKFEDFYEKSFNEWNLDGDKNQNFFLELADKYLTLSPDEFEKSDIGKIFYLLEQIQNCPEIFFGSYILPKEILKRRSMGSSHPEVQLLVKMMYENKRENSSEFAEMTIDQFVRFESSNYKSGDIARFNEQNFGIEGCSFIADAIAVFGDYKCYDEVED